MAITYGFYNSVNGDRVYDANDFASIFDGLVNDGVYMGIGDRFATTPGGTDLKVNVGTGRGWFQHTWIYNSLPISYTLSPANTTYSRIDAIFIKIDKDARENSLEVVTGNPSSSPVKPSKASTSMIFYYPIAYITVRAGATTILSSDIENTVGSNVTPYVNGIIETVSIEHLVNNKWQPEFDAFLTSKDRDYTDWKNAKELDCSDLLNTMQVQYSNLLTTMQTQYNTWIGQKTTEYDTWVEQETTEYNDFISRLESEYESWFDQVSTEFAEWFENLHYILDGDVAGHLQNEIEVLQGDISRVSQNEFIHYHNLCNCTSNIVRNSIGDIIRITSTDSDDSITSVMEFTKDGDSNITTETISEDGKTYYYMRTIVETYTSRYESYQKIERGAGE